MKSSSSVPALKKMSSSSGFKTMATKNLLPPNPKLKSVEVVKKKTQMPSPQKKMVTTPSQSSLLSKKLTSGGGFTFKKTSKKKKKSKFKKKPTKNSLDEEMSEISSDGFQMGQTEGLPDQFTPEKTGALESSR
mmetsp:Transcript_42141/g.64628  ORF Transcript_42141/g.64628 Transcript_42141/m.64628 type:complete len:133 (-) Transcript_42141:737-1135(-)